MTTRAIIKNILIILGFFFLFSSLLLIIKFIKFSNLQFNEIGRFYDAKNEVVYTSDSILGYGIMAFISSFITLVLVVLILKLRKLN